MAETKAPENAQKGEAAKPAGPALAELDDGATTAEGPGAAGALPHGEEHDDSGRLVRTAKDLEAIYDVPVQVSAVLGKATMQVNQLLRLGRGAVVELDRKVGEAIDIYVNNRLVARGEVVVVDERLGVTMTEIVKSERG